jgi:uncharacterized membrane protein YbhN (UPF0104 family)
MSQKTVTKKPAVTIRLQPKQIIIILSLVLILYVIIPQLSSFRHSFALIAHAEHSWVLFAAVCYMCTSVMSVFIYRLLAPRHLPLIRTAVVQYGSSFANRLLPAGIGALGVGYFYLRKQKCTPAAALAVVSLNNILGTVGHGLLLILVALLVPATFQHVHVGLHSGSKIGLVTLAAVLLGFVAVLLYMKFRRRLRTIIGETAAKLGGYRHQKTKVAAALLFSLMLTLLYATCLWASAMALQISITLPAALVILGVGVTVGAAIPSPGGLGGAEAGLVAGLAALGTAVSTAIAVAIVYRLVTYWLGFAVGAAGFFAATRRGYL